MDFRTVDPAGIAWTRTPRGALMARTPAGAKVIVQTPTCGCRAETMGSGMYRLVMTLREDQASHSAFAAWAGAVEASAAADPSVSGWREHRTLSTGVYNGTMRFVAFSDTLAFDGAGKLSADYLDATSCTLLLELQGLWATDGRWGLRWKVLQYKFSVDPADPADPQPAASNPASKSAKSMFLDDDA